VTLLETANRISEGRAQDSGLHQQKKPRAKRGFLIGAGLLVANAIVIARPPIRAACIDGPQAQPPAIVIRVVVGAVDPDPYTIPEDPMATAVVEVVAL
jgi:hypothetical protein